MNTYEKNKISKRGVIAILLCCLLFIVVIHVYAMQNADTTSDVNSGDIAYIETSVPEETELATESTVEPTVEPTEIDVSSTEPPDATENATEHIPVEVIEEPTLVDETEYNTYEELVDTPTEKRLDSIVEVDEESTYQHSESDLYYLAAAVCSEAGGESEEIQMMVANVIMNRVASDSFPDTIERVLTQPYQYGMMWEYGVSFPSWATAEVQNQCYTVAQRVLDGERVCPDNVVFQAEFVQGSGVYMEYPGFYFCYQ